MNDRWQRRSLAALERDAALARAGRVRRWTIAGTAALTAAFAALVGAIAPGRSLGAKRSAAATTTASTASSSSSSAMPPLASAGQLGLQGPSQSPQPGPDQTQTNTSPQQSTPPAQQAAPAPQPAPTPAPVVSGGS
jgi:hypothetical protein